MNQKKIQVKQIEIRNAARFNQDQTTCAMRTEMIGIYVFCLLFVGNEMSINLKGIALILKQIETVINTN